MDKYADGILVWDEKSSRTLSVQIFIGFIVT